MDEGNVLGVGGDPFVEDPSRVEKLATALVVGSWEVEFGTIAFASAAQRMTGQLSSIW